MSQHTCHALRCEERVAPKLLMCPKHWAMVPRENRKRIWATYRKGQEERFSPSNEYLIAAREAIYAVAIVEGMMAKDQAKDKIERLRSVLDD